MQNTLEERIKVHVRFLFFFILWSVYYITLLHQFFIYLFIFIPGSVAVLPTVLYLLLGVLRELVREYGGVDTEKLVSGTLQALRTVLSSPMSRVEKSCHAWVQLLRCALVTLLMCWNTGKPPLILKVIIIGYPSM